MLDIQMPNSDILAALPPLQSELQLQGPAAATPRLCTPRLQHHAIAGLPAQNPDTVQELTTHAPGAGFTANSSARLSSVTSSSRATPRHSVSRPPVHIAAPSTRTAPAVKPFASYLRPRRNRQLRSC